MHAISVHIAHNRSYILWWIQTFEGEGRLANENMVNRGAYFPVAEKFVEIAEVKFKIEHFGEFTDDNSWLFNMSVQELVWENVNVNEGRPSSLLNLPLNVCLFAVICCS